MSRACDVARTATPGHRPRTLSTNTPTPSTRCSQLSRTSSASRSARWASTCSSLDRPGESARPSVRLTAAGTSASSVTGTRSTNHTPSRQRSATAAATAVARRVLPTPPGPSAVTSRSADTAWTRSATSVDRPTNEVSGTGTDRRDGAAGPAPRSPRSSGVRMSSMRSPSWEPSSDGSPGPAAEWASRARARRSATSSLRSSDDTWLSTVRTETNRRAAISAFVARSATSSSTSASRSDTPASINACRSATGPVCPSPHPSGRELCPLSGRSVVDPWSVRGGSVAVTDGESPGQAHDQVTDRPGGTPMNHHETIAIAEQHRADLLADGASTRRRRSVRMKRRFGRKA